MDPVTMTMLAGLATTGGTVIVGTAITALNGVVSALKATNKALNTFNEWQDKAQRASLALGQSFENVSKEIGFSFEKLNKSISIQLQNNLDNLNYNLEYNNKLSISSNQSLDKTTKTNESLQTSMDGLRGSLSDQLGSVFETLKVGFQGNAQGVASLINQQKLLGVSYTKTANTFLRLENGLNLSREATNELGPKLMKLGSEWTISSDKLVDAINSISDTLPYQELAGWGSDFAETVASLTAKLGSSVETELSQFLKMFTDTTLEGYRKLNALGIAEYRERFSYAKSSNEQLAILEDAIRIGSNTFKTFVGKGGDVFINAEAAAGALGRSAAAIKVLDDNINKRTKTNSEADWTDTIGLMKREIWNPLKGVFLEQFYPILKGLYNVISSAQLAGINEFAKYLKNNKIAIIDTARQITLAALDLIVVMISQIPTLVSTIKSLVSTLGNIANLFSSLASDLFGLDAQRAQDLGITQTQQFQALIKSQSLTFVDGQPQIFDKKLMEATEKYAEDAMKSIELGVTDVLGGRWGIAERLGEELVEGVGIGQPSVENYKEGYRKALEESYRLLNEDPKRKIESERTQNLIGASVEGINKLRNFIESIDLNTLGIKEEAKATNDLLAGRNKTASSYLNRSNDILEAGIRKVLGYDNTNHLKTLVTLNSENNEINRTTMTNQFVNRTLDRANAAYMRPRLSP
jgi:hypothetical protein